MKLPGMMCVVIEHIGAMIGALELKSASGTVEAMKAFLYSLAANAQHIGGSGGGQSVGNVVLAGHSQGDMGIEFAVDHYVKFAAAVVESHIFCLAIGAVISDGEGEHRVSQALYAAIAAAVIGIGNARSPAEAPNLQRRGRSVPRLSDP